MCSKNESGNNVRNIVKLDVSLIVNDILCNIIVNVCAIFVADSVCLSWKFLLLVVPVFNGSNYSVLRINWSKVIHFLFLVFHE